MTHIRITNEKHKIEVQNLWDFAVTRVSLDYNSFLLSLPDYDFPNIYYCTIHVLVGFYFFFFWHKKAKWIISNIYSGLELKACGGQGDLEGLYVLEQC